ncbi:MAG: class I SAM-dependent methyltransferase [Candidatus Dormibacteria bacterium]
MTSAESLAAGGEFVYTGRRYLEVIKAAQNYNELLFHFADREVSAADDVLDFGAGEGGIASRLALKARSVTCVEPDAAFRRSLLARGLPCTAGLAGVPDDSIDVVYSFNVLEHIEGDDAVLAALHAKLRDAGRLVLYVPAFQCLYNSMDEVSGHVRRYRLRQLEEKLTRAGFDVERMEYVDSLGFAATLLWKLVDRGSGAIESWPIYVYDRYVFWLSRLVDVAAHRLVGKNLLARGRKGRHGHGA